MQIEQLPVAELKAYDRNSRTHDKNQIKAVADSIKEFGFTNPLLLRDDNTIIAGHGRLQAVNNFELGQHGRYRSNVWDYPIVSSFANTHQGGKATKPEETRMHPTVKPLELVADAIMDCSNQGDTILDLFLGSGTTLIAAEKTGRICYGMELSEHHCDVIITRWENFTGKKAELLNP